MKAMGTCVLKKQVEGFEEGKEYTIIQIWGILGKTYLVIENAKGRKASILEEEASITNLR